MDQAMSERAIEATCYTQRTISHDEAREIAGRLINSHFRQEPHDRVGIPARPDYDDDLLIIAYIRQQEAAALPAAQRGIKTPNQEAAEGKHCDLDYRPDPEIQKLGELNAVLVCEIEQLRKALEAVVADVLEYERVNNLSPNPGKPDCWQSITRAKAALALSPGEVEGWREINVNDNVRVKLTARGRELHRRNHEQLVASLPASAKLQYYAPKEDADGWSEWQLWCLMQEFGPHILMGCEPPFETTIKLPSPPISSRAEAPGEKTS